MNTVSNPFLINGTFVPAPSPGAWYRPYAFSFTDGTVTPSETVESYNDFKKDPGIGGLVLQSGTGQPIENAAVEIWQGTKKMGSASTDADGWYMWSYKYTGKAATFTVKLLSGPGVPSGQTQTVTLKSNGYLVVNFTVQP